MVVLLSPLREKAEPSPGRGRVPGSAGTVPPLGQKRLWLGGGNASRARGLDYIEQR